MIKREKPTNGYYALRWAVLERDNFTCQYCGQYAPNVKLEVDHVIPVAEGGQDEMSNLKTSCYACNRGRSGLRIRQKSLRTYISRKRFLPALRHEQIKDFIMAQDAKRATTSQIADALKKDRGNVNRKLTSIPGFVKLDKVGKQQFYGVVNLVG